MPRYNTVARMDCTDRAADLMYAIIAQAVEDYRDLSQRGIINNGHSGISDDAWPQKTAGHGPRTENCKYLAYYHNPQQIEELCEYIGDGIDRTLEVVGSNIDARTVRRKLGVESRGQERKTGADNQ